MDGARPTGLGDAFTSVATGADGIFHNPAGIATARMYAIGGTYEYTPSANILNVSVVDSKTNPTISAGAAYSYLLGHDKETDSSGHDIRLGLAMPVLPNKISIGVGGRLLLLNQNDVDFARGFTMDAGVLFQPFEKFHIGVSGRNLLDVCKQPARCRGVTPLLIATGLSFGDATNFLVSGDVEVDVTSEADAVNMNYQFGAEYMIAGVVPVRLGYQHRTLGGGHFVSAGAGYRQSRFGLDLGSRLDVTSPSHFNISASFSVYIN